MRAVVRFFIHLLSRRAAGPTPRRRIDYAALAERINREHAEALELLDAYDCGEARIVDGRLQRM